MVLVLHIPKEIQLGNISALLLLSSCICVPYFMSQIKFAYLDYFTNHPERITLYFICFLRTKLSYVMYQIRSVVQSCPTLCDPMNHSTPGIPFHHQLPEFTQTHIHRVSDAIQPSHPLSSPSPLVSNPSQHQSLFQ